MNLLILKDLLSGAWQIDSSTLNSLIPILKSITSGVNFEKSNEPTINRNYIVSSKGVNMGYYADDQEVDDSGEHKVKVVHVLPLRSVITKHDQDCGPCGTRTLGLRLLRADSDPSVIGHIIVVESGGGQAMAVAELSEAIEKCTKPVVSWVDGCACSAAYYISSYAREIIASRANDIVGCIGTMIVYQGRTNKSEANSEGERQVSIYADSSFEKNEEYEKAINEFDFQLVKTNLLNPLNDKFKSDVVANRSSIIETQLTGKTYFASEVIGSLVDSIGDFDFAMQRVIALSGFTQSPETGENFNNSNNQSKRVEMKKQFLNVNKVLVIDELVSSDEGVYLNEDQLENIDASLAQRETLQNDVTVATAAVNAITAERDAAQAATATALSTFDAIDPTIASATTPEAKVLAVRALLSSKLGAAPVGNQTTVDNTTESSNTEADWEVINNLPHNKNVDINS